jgi:GDPmannose 4,6-dehydratase
MANQQSEPHMKSALITGITGQDGVYLVELLLGKGYRVIGAVRDVHKAVAKLPAQWVGTVELVEWDMLDQQKMIEVLSSHRPTELYNFAAYSTGAGMFNDPVGMGEVNGLAVARILEAIRAVDVNIRFCQASSREIFGEAVESPQTERTVVNPRSPYGAAKLYADAMVRIYRQQYGLFACSAILFNHESPRRGLAFVTRKITHEASRIKLGQTKVLHLGNLDALRDWGFAGDTVHAMWLMLQQDHADDYVVATGETHSVREFCECAFGHLALDYRDYVRDDASVYRPVETAVLVSNADKARTELGWSPKVGFKELVHMMVDADMQTLEKN